MSPGFFLLRCDAMLHFLLGFVALFVVWPVRAAERHFDFSGARLNQEPRGFRSTVSGEGKPGEWKVVEDESHPSLAPPDVALPVTTRHQVLAQLSREATGEHFPLFIFEDQSFDDFTLTTKFKTVSGSVEQMAGVAFRIQDEKNYYIARASALGKNFRFYKFVNGGHTDPIGPTIEIRTNFWHELTIECVGNRIRCFLDGKQAMPDITDTTFTEGKVGFWTKSDSVSYFGDTRIVYRPKEALAALLVRKMLERYPRLLGLRVYGTTEQKRDLHVIASDNNQDLGRPASEVEKDVVARGVVYCGRGKKETLLTLPLHDRNGETIAAVRVVLRPYPGQTEQAALARATPIVKEMERRVHSARDLSQ
ncbi:MAG: hypothetical protein DME21_04800 [Verrucomicrobia bacterium]|nr:MAG: hypothetical protein DME21_04800 [Verrucomicrobiota bacterium]